MKTVVLDTYAVIAFMGRQPGWEEVAELLSDAAEGEATLLLSVVNWGEALYITERRHGVHQADALVEELDLLPIEIVLAERRLTREAARLKARGGISYADCFAAALALLEDGAIATGDPEFAQLEGENPIRWISRRPT